jgi:hypothetical protein
LSDPRLSSSPSQNQIHRQPVPTRRTISIGPDGTDASSKSLVLRDCRANVMSRSLGDLCLPLLPCLFIGTRPATACKVLQILQSWLISLYLSMVNGSHLLDKAPSKLQGLGQPSIPWHSLRPLQGSCVTWHASKSRKVKSSVHVDYWARPKSKSLTRSRYWNI